MLGSIEVRRRRWSIGYWLAGDARGRGIVTRALRLVCAGDLGGRSG